MIKLFDVENGHIKPTEHCYVIESLKRIMDEYPDEYMKIYAYLFYKACMNEDLNPFANVPESDKEDFILKEVGGNFSVDEEAISTALDTVLELYKTPTYHAYMGIKIYLEHLATYMATSPITDGRDGNIMAGLKVAEKYNEVRQSYNQTYKDFKDEQSTRGRGGQQISYDQ